MTAYLAGWRYPFRTAGSGQDRTLCAGQVQIARLPGVFLVDGLGDAGAADQD